MELHQFCVEKGQRDPRKIVKPSSYKPYFKQASTKLGHKSIKYVQTWNVPPLDNAGMSVRIGVGGYFRKVGGQRTFRSGVLGAPENFEI
jgi:hypothetical protein